MRTPTTRRSLLHWASWFEARGVYIPGEDNNSLNPWREYGWLIVLWLVGIGLFVLLFALAR